MTRYRLRTLGELRLYRGNARSEQVMGQAKSLAVLAYLATLPERRADRARLARLFWPESDSKHARRALRQAIYYLSRRTGDELVVSEDSILALAGDLLTVDLWRLDRAAAAGEYQTVVDLHGGPFLAGLEAPGPEVEAWIDAQQEQVRARVRTAYLALARRSMDEGDEHTALRYAGELVELEPMDADAQEALMAALRASPRPEEALAVYEAFEAALLDEMGEVEPGPKLTERMAELHRAVFASPGADASISPPKTRSGFRVATGVAAAGLLVGLLAVFGPWSSGGEPLSRSLELLVSHGPSRFVAQVRLRDGTVAFDSLGRLWDGPRFVDEDRVVFARGGSSGRDLAVEEVGTAEPRILLGGREEEFPLAVSPDGREVLYRWGRFGHAEARYERGLAFLDLETGESRPLDVPRPEGEVWAAWSPDGTALALALERGDGKELLVTGSDGGDPRVVADSVTGGSRPAWSPDGRWLAFSRGPTGRADLYRVRRDGAELEQLTATRSSELDPVWITGGQIVFLTVRGGRGDLYLQDLARGESRRLTRRGDLHDVWDARRVSPDSSWVGEVNIESRVRRASPGQRLDLRSRVSDVRGEPVTHLERRVRWISETPSVIGFDGHGRPLRERASGERVWARALGTGEGTVVARLGGWRSDTLRLVVSGVARQDPAVLLHEGWSSGISARRWVRWGDPDPFTRDLAMGGASPDVGYPASALIPNGDESYSSGVTSTKA